MAPDPWEPQRPVEACLRSRSGLRASKRTTSFCLSARDSGDWIQAHLQQSRQAITKVLPGAGDKMDSNICFLTSLQASFEDIESSVQETSMQL
ncbi:hypothetical protein NDU88_003784 [Pleurodeles waltl]|uniref:Uncharacterized protein n=1 Tax=Pleurodeles waltl TaxID=8319 RepID=A0AAV7KZF8_PLEWA|nr:hypothetical protein NDU88_003784 [Pleurodeles waltl]